MSISLSQFMAAYLEWTGVRHELTGPARRTFARWVAEVKPELMAPYGDRIVEFAQQCQEVKRMCSGPPSAKAVGPETLKRYMSDLVKIYRAMPEKIRPTFMDFLESVKAGCANKRALEAYIALHSSKQTKPEGVTDGKA